MFKDGISGRWKGPFTRIDKVAFSEDFMSGMKLNDIAVKYGVKNRISVRNWAKALGLSRKRRRPDLVELNRKKLRFGEDNAAYGYRKVSWASRGAVKKLYKMYGKNYKLAAVAIGVCPTTMRRMIHELGLSSCNNQGRATENTVFVERIRHKAYNMPYFFKWTPNLQKRIRMREKGCCFLCGVKIVGRFPVHHIFYDLTLSDDRHLVALCTPCHAKTNYDREGWTRFFMKRLSEMYSYTYEDMIEGGECALVRVV